MVSYTISLLSHKLCALLKNILCSTLSQYKFKTKRKFNLSDSVIPAVTHKLINDYARYRMYAYPLKNSCFFVCVFVTQLGKIIINVANHQNRAFHSQYKDMSRPCISCITIC